MVIAPLEALPADGVLAQPPSIMPGTMVSKPRLRKYLFIVIFF